MQNRFDSRGRNPQQNTAEIKTVKVHGQDIRIVLKQVPKEGWRASSDKPKVTIVKPTRVEAIRAIVSHIRQNYIWSMVDAEQTMLTCTKSDVFGKK